MRTRNAARLIVLVLGSSPLVYGAQAARQPIDLSKYPAAVRATIERETANATLRKISKETEKGKTLYEVETMVGQRTRDLLIDPSGAIVEVEEEIALDAAPAAVRDAAQGRGKVLKIEQVTREGVTTYEVEVQAKTGRKSEVTLDAQGKPAKG
jgi:uncharacterized membrane protein YkoI